VKKNLFSKIVLAVLLIAVAVSSLACKKVIEEVGVLPNQVKNHRYYYQQGYDNDWDAQADQNEFMLDDATGLLFKANPKAAPDKVEYRVYFKQQLYTGLGVSTDAIGYIMNENHPYYFNRAFIYEDGSARESFISAENWEDARYNKMQFYHVSYTFVKNGEPWKGVYNMIMKANDCFVITFEAAETEFDLYKEDYNELMSDWRKLGWETSND